jgi:hypothetical protein
VKPLYKNKRDELSFSKFLFSFFTKAKRNYLWKINLFFTESKEERAGKQKHHKNGVLRNLAFS